MRKIMIFYASYGGGHLSAARSIKENIEANYKDVEVMLVDCMYYVNKFFDKVTTTAYSEMAKKIPQTWGKVYWHAQSGPIAQISTTSNKLLSKKLNTLLKNFNPELIISTHPFASTMCAYLKKQGKLPQDKDTKFIAFGGDGGTYDIGLQSLSGAMERGHDMVYVCYDNGAYMNTGIQRSSATPKFADTTTSPAGKVIPGKMQIRKDLTKIMADHHIPYVAQTLAMTNFKDLYEKSEKAIYTKGPAFLNVMAPCPRGWGYATEDLMKINKLAADTCYWPLYEVVDGKYHITYKPAKKLPVEEFLRPQKRFKHMFKPGNEWMIEEFQKEVDKRWNELLELEEITNK